MKDWTTINAHFEALAAQEGLLIKEIAMPSNRRGAYDHHRQTIYLAKNLPMRHRVATLAHEYHHHLRGHTGPQPQHVEDSVDEAAAKMIIDPDAYARAETAVGSHPGALAVELDTPKWIVEAWQRILARSVRPH